MDITTERPDVAAKLAERDLTLDLARVACVVLVVVIHVLFAGVRVTDAGIEVEHTVELQPWFAAVTWIFEIMPLFFVVGGFASATAYRSARKRGASDADYVRGRLLRLARPALPVFAFFGATLLVIGATSVDRTLVSAVAVAVGSPLWFLSSFLIVQACVPLLLRLHERRPVVTLITLVAAAAAVDAMRTASGEVLLGLPNVLFVWAACHQLGFWMRDGFFARRRPVELVGIIVLAYLALWGLVSTGAYSWNMLANQYPPTLPLVCLAVAQAAALRLAYRPLSALMRTCAARAVVYVVGSRAMTIYCWHSPAIMLLLGLQLLVPATLSEPGSTRWWWERILFTALVLAVLWLLSLALARFEEAPSSVPAGSVAPGAARVALACVLFTTAPFFIAMLGMNTGLAVAGLVGTVAALRLVRPRTAADVGVRVPPSV